MDRRWKTCAAWSLGLLLPASGAWAAGAADRPAKADVPVEQVPPAVRGAAAGAVEGIRLSEAKLRHKKPGDVYKLSGTAGGRRYELKVDADGNVLAVNGAERGGPRRGAGVAKPGKRLAPKRVGPGGVRGRAGAATPAVRLGAIVHPAVRESSGVVASRRHPGVYWTHNDKGNPPALFAIGRDGRLLAEFAVDAPNVDWEDVAADDRGNLYVGDVGNNHGERRQLTVYQIAEPDPAAGAAPLRPARTWRLRFPAAPFNCESLFVFGRHGYVVSKVPAGGQASAYRFPLDAGPDVALEKVATLPVFTPVTGADLSPDGRRLAVLSRSGLHLFPVDRDPRRAGAAKPAVVPVPRGKLEGVCFTPDGVLLTAEGRDVYLLAEEALRRAAEAANGQAGR